MDDGRLTDSQGRNVNFRNTVIIMTSNVGSHLFMERDSRDEIKSKITQVLRGTFKPEFLNRIDEIIIFNRLSERDIEKIVGIQLQYVKERIGSRNINITI